jgi:hypothetical protein
MKALMAPLPDKVRKKLDAIGVKGTIKNADGVSKQPEVQPNQANEVIQPREEEKKAEPIV